MLCMPKVGCRSTISWFIVSTFLNCVFFFLSLPAPPACHPSPPLYVIVTGIVSWSDGWLVVNWMPDIGPPRIKQRPRSDQNFGLNDLAAIQDVRNEYSLQDIDDDPSVSVDRGKVNAVNGDAEPFDKPINTTGTKTLLLFPLCLFLALCLSVWLSVHLFWFDRAILIGMINGLAWVTLSVTISKCVILCETACRQRHSQADVTGPMIDSRRTTWDYAVARAITSISRECSLGWRRLTYYVFLLLIVRGGVVVVVSV